jgi:energy-coupling factor transporter ATP-binding protein EcfA2
VTRLPEGKCPNPRRVATPQDFGRELSLAREQAELTVRQVARAVGIPVSTAGGYFAGTHLPLPTQTATLRKIIAVCGMGGAEQAEAWVQALSRARRPPGRRRNGDPAPYKGLAAFQAEDAAWFFGRQELTKFLVDVACDASLNIPVVVAGPSGSGKSSVLRAGLVPHLESLSTAQPYPWFVRVFSPAAAPLVALAEQLSGVIGQDATLLATEFRARPIKLDGLTAGISNSAATAGAPGIANAGITGTGQDNPAAGGNCTGGQLALIVDQFEEVFAACPDEHERVNFISALSALSRAGGLVVLGLRSDFYDRALRYPELAAGCDR